MIDVAALLDEWTARGARLLHCERLPLRASRDPSRALILMLTFDCGILRIEAGGEGDRLEFGLVEGSDAELDGGVSGDDEDPWWALLGTELCGVRIDADSPSEPRRARFQFRPDGQNPRFVRLSARNGQLRVISDREAHA